MSRENGVIFTVLKKKCKAVRIENENDPFTISLRNFSPELEINVSACGDHPAIKDGEKLPDVLLDKFDYKNLANKPLEEVDPEFINKQTFLVIGKDGSAFRLSAKKSSFIFNPFNSLRRLCIFILSNWQLPVLIGISLCFLCLSFVVPNYASNSVATVVWNFTRYSFGGLLLTEIFVKVVARGILVAEFTYLRSSWDWFDLLILLIVFANFYWKSLILHSLEGVVLLKFIPIVPAFKNGFQITIQILKNLVPVLVYSLLTIWILVVVGFHIKSYQQLENAPRNNCQVHFHSNESSPQVENNQYPLKLEELQRNYELNLPIHNVSQREIGYGVTKENSSSIMLNSSYNYECMENKVLLQSPLTNITLQTVGIITLKAFGGSKEIDPLQNQFLYVTLTLIFGTFGVSVLTAASVGLTIFTLRLGHQPTHKRDDDDNNRPRKYTCLPEFQCDIGALHKIRELVFHPFFELFITTIICVDIALISWTIIKSPETFKLRWILKYGQEICMIIYVVEFLLKICTSPSRYLKNWWPLLDFSVVVIYTLNKFFPVPTLLKLRALKITSRWPTLQLILLVLFKSLWLRLNVLCVLLLGLISFRIIIATCISGAIDEKNFLLTAISQSFLLSDWKSSFATCATSIGVPFCLMTWFLEIIIGIVLMAVILMTVINYTCELVSRPVDCYCDNDNYQNLCKAVANLFQCCSPKEKIRSSNSSLSQNEIHVPVPVLNGGPKAYHHNEMQTSNNGPELQPRRNSQISSIFEFFQNFPISSCMDLTIISSATTTLVVKFDTKQRLSPHLNPRFYIDLVFVSYFFFILLWSLFKSNFKLLKSPSWLLDLLIISASGFSLYTFILGSKTLGNVPFVQIITMLSCCRGLMLVTRVEWLKAGVIGIITGVRALWRYLLTLFLAWLCLVLLKNYLAEFNNKWIINGDGIVNIYLHNVAEKIATNSSILIICITLLGIFIGVTISELLGSELLASFMTLAQCNTYKDKELGIQREKTMHIPAPKSGLCVQVTHYMTLTPAFDVTVMTTILCDCLVITMSHLATSKDWKIIWEHYPIFIISLYVCELSMKLVGWGKYFLKSGWNFFDSFIVIIGIIDILFIKVQIRFVTADTIRFLRILRIFQVQLFSKRAKFMTLFYSALLRVIPCIGNLLLLFILLVYTYATIHSTSPSIDDSAGFQDWMKSLNKIVVLLITLPFYGDINNFHFTQMQICWSEYHGIVVIIYCYSYLILSYLILGYIFAIILYEILKFVSIRGDLYSAQENLPRTEDDNENKYKHTNGRLGFLDLTKNNDDPDSVATMLTPIEPMAEDPLADDEIYPLRISANGYILHVEAIVTTV